MSIILHLMEVVLRLVLTLLALAHVPVILDTFLS